MLFELQESVKSEEDKFIQKIADLETRLAIADQASGDNHQVDKSREKLFFLTELNTHLFVNLYTFIRKQVLREGFWPFFC